MSPKSVFQFGAVCCIWGTTWLVIRYQLGTVDPSWSIAYRFAVGGLALLAWCAVRGETLRIPRRGWGFVLLLAVLQFVLNFNFVYRAELFVPSGLVAVAFALLMVPNAIFAKILLDRSITRRFALGSLLGIVGVGMLFAHQFSLPGDRAAVALGLSLTFAGILCASFSNVMQATPLGRELPSLGALAWAMLIGAAINAAIASVVAGPPTWDWRPEYAAGVLMLGIVASALAFGLYFDLVRTIGPAEAAWTGIPIPIIAMALSTVFEDYRWSALAIAGTVVAMIGLVIALRMPKPVSAADVPEPGRLRQAEG